MKFEPPMSTAVSIPRPGPAALLALGLFACGGGGPVHLPPPPGLDEAEALVLVLEVEGRGPRVFATAADARPLLDVPLPADESARITALGYRADLEGLGLEAGEVLPVAPDVCGARTLPEPQALAEVAIEAGAAEGWRPRESLPEGVVDFRIAGPCPCSRFETVRTRSAPSIPVAGWSAGGLAVLVTANGRVLEVDATGEVRAEVFLDPAPERGIRDAVEAPDGELWVATSSAVWRGTREAGLTRVATVSESLRAIDGGPGPSGFELYGATREGSLLSLHPGLPRVLSTRLPGPSRSNQEADVLWVGPGEVVAAEQDSLDIVRVRGGALVSRASMPPESTGANLLVEVPGLGILALSAVSQVYLLEGAELQSVPSPLDVSEPRSAARFGAGLVYTGDGGYLQELQPGFGFCPTQLLDGRPRKSQVFTAGDNLLLYGPAATSSATLMVVEPRPLREG